MDAFNYTDLFATKGLEYILIIFFLVLLVVYWRVVNNMLLVKNRAREIVEKSRSYFVDWFNLAENYYYHKGHTWVNFENGDKVKIGLDDFSQRLIGTADEYLLPQPGDNLSQGKMGIRILKDQKLIDILSPVEGEVIEINNQVYENPELVNQDPYNNGWLLKVSVKRPKHILLNLFSGKAAQGWMEDTVENLNRKITGELGLVLQDGGEPVIGFAKEIAGDEWDKLTAEFLHTEFND